MGNNRRGCSLNALRALNAARSCSPCICKLPQSPTIPPNIICNSITRNHTHLYNILYALNFASYLNLLYTIPPNIICNSITWNDAHLYTSLALFPVSLIQLGDKIVRCS